MVGNDWWKRFGHCRKRLSETVVGMDFAIDGEDSWRILGPCRKIVGKDLVIVGKNWRRWFGSLSDNIVGKDLTIVGNDWRKRYGHCRKRLSETIVGKDLAIGGKQLGNYLVILGNDRRKKVVPLSEKIVGKDLGIVGKASRERFGHCRKRLKDAIWPLSEKNVGVDGRKRRGHWRKRFLGKYFGHCLTRSSERFSAIVGNDCLKRLDHCWENCRKRSDHCRKRLTEKIWPLSKTIDGKHCRTRFGHCRKNFLGNDFGHSRKRLTEKI